MTHSQPAPAQRAPALSAPSTSGAQDAALSQPLDKLRLFGRDFKADPYPVYARLRAEAPVLRRPVRNAYGLDTGICFVTRYDDVAAMLRDTSTFVKDIRNTMTAAEAAAAPQPPGVLALVSNHMLNQDAPHHTRLRSLVNRAFTGPMVERLEPRILAVAQELLGRVAKRLHAGEPVDLIAQFALPLPIIVIAELLGIPSRDRNRFRTWSNALVSPNGDGERMARKLEKSGQLIEDFIRYLRVIFAERRARPADDLISSLLRQNTGSTSTDLSSPALTSDELTSDELTEHELFSMLLLLIVVGHETTVNLIGNGVLALLQQSALWQALRENPALVPHAVEESLRFDCPVERAPMRYAARDLSWHGVTIRRGDHISLVLGSANRDETRFDHADQFRLDRPENRHLAFGLGPHYCLGAPLARLEGRIAFELLSQQFPDLALAISPHRLRWRPHPIMRGLTRLPVRLSR